MIVTVLGASDNPERYSNMAIKLLLQHGHTVIPVNPQKKQIEGIPTVAEMKTINEKVDVVTLYVGPDKLEKMVPEIIALRPKLVIFNPGTESEKAQNELKDNNIRFIEACTLVLLKTNRFENEVGF